MCPGTSRLSESRDPQRTARAGSVDPGELLRGLSGPAPRPRRAGPGHRGQAFAGAAGRPEGPGRHRRAWEGQEGTGGPRRAPPPRRAACRCSSPSPAGARAERGSGVAAARPQVRPLAFCRRRGCPRDAPAGEGTASSPRVCLCVSVCARVSMCPGGGPVAGTLPLPWRSRPEPPRAPPGAVPHLAAGGAGAGRAGGPGPLRRRRCRGGRSPAGRGGKARRRPPPAVTAPVPPAGAAPSMATR